MILRRRAISEGDQQDFIHNGKETDSNLCVHSESPQFLENRNAHIRSCSDGILPIDAIQKTKDQTKRRISIQDGSIQLHAIMKRQRKRRATLHLSAE